MRANFALLAALICVACGGSDYAVAEGLSDSELQSLIVDCGLEEGDFESEDGKLILSKDLEFKIASCVLKSVKSMEKLVGPDVGNKKYVTPGESK